MGGEVTPVRTSLRGNGLFEERLLLGVVDGGAAGRGAGALGPGDDAYRATAGELLDAAAGEVAGAHVAGFLLCPDDLGLVVPSQLGRDLALGPRVQLLEPHDRDVRLRLVAA